MSKLTITECTAFEGPAYHYTNEEGFPAAILMPVLVARGHDDSLWQLPNDIITEYTDDGFTYHLPRISLFKAREIAEKAYDRGFIETDHWVRIEESDLKAYVRGSYGVAA